MVAAIATHPIGAFSGFLIWAAHFLFVYVFTGLACARRFAHAEISGVDVVLLVNGVATALALVAAAIVLVGGLRGPRGGGDAHPDPREGAHRFLRHMTALMAGLGIVGILWSAVPIAMVPACP